LDCDDSDYKVNPNRDEICGNDKDDDCSGGDEVCPPEICGDRKDNNNSGKIDEGCCASCKEGQCSELAAGSNSVDAYSGAMDQRIELFSTSFADSIPFDFYLTYRSYRNISARSATTGITATT